MRPNFTSSRLVRLLRDPAESTPESARQDVGERLGDWVSAYDAMSVHSAHQAIEGVGEFRSAQPPAPRALALQAQCQRVRAALASAIVSDRGDDEHDGGMRQGAGQALAEPQTSYVGFRQRHAEHQRQMETQIASLRADARQALSRSSARLRKLAMLDAVMEQTLGAREQRLLSTVPQFLERRFVQLRKGGQAQADAPSGAGGWVDAFTREWQGALLAELDLRLQPVVGMIEAIESESKKYP